MNKKIGAMILAMTMVLSLSMTTLASAAVPVVDKSQMTASAISAINKVTVNGVKLNANDGTGRFWIDATGRTQAPVRLLVESMGYSISYNKGVVTVPGGPNGDLVITIGSDKLTVGGSEVKMDTIGATIDGRTYIPLRFVAEALGAKVDAKGSSSGLNVSITTTFTPERKINGVKNEANFMLCENMMKFHDENQVMFTNEAYSKYESTRWVTYYRTQNSGELVLTIMSLGSNGYEITGLDFTAEAQKQYDLVYAFLKDTVENPDAIYAKLKERNDIISKGWSPKDGFTAEAGKWLDAEANKSYTIGNVLFTWDDSTFGFTISKASN